MKILITGTKGLATALGNIYRDHNVTLVSRSTGFDITRIRDWGKNFLDYDCVFNCAYDGFGQVQLLEFFFENWHADPTKTIVSIGSKVVSQPRTGAESGYWAYRLHKHSLQIAHDAMLQTAKCDMKLINPGPIDTDMIKHINCDKFDVQALASKIKNIVLDSSIKKVDLWL